MKTLDGTSGLLSLTTCFQNLLFKQLCDDKTVTYESFDMVAYHYYLHTKVNVRHNHPQIVLQITK